MIAKQLKAVLVVGLFILLSLQSLARDTDPKKRTKSSCETVILDLPEFTHENEKVIISPKLKVPMVVNGLSKTPPVPATSAPIIDTKKRHVTIIGGGLAGLTSALELSNQGYSVLILDEKEKLGGLASGNTRAGFEYDNGTAYFSPLIPEQEPIFKQLGLQNYEKVAPIDSPSDALYIEGGIRTTSGKLEDYFADFWENEDVLNELPASFALTKWVHEMLDEEERIPTQPFEESDLTFDQMDYETFLHSQYGILKDYVKKNKNDREAKALLDRVDSEIASGRLDPRITADHKGIMDAVIRYYVNNYGHSAMGGYAHQISAALGLNFVVSEMTTRYTYPLGTGEIAKRTEKILRERNKIVDLRTNSKVESVKLVGDGVETVYVHNGKRYAIRSEHVIYAGPIAETRRIVKDIDRLAPRHSRIIRQMENRLTDYLVTPVFIDGHPSVVTGVYDLWLGREKFDTSKPTDFISGRWAQYDGYTVHVDKNDKYGVITMYHPLGPSTERSEEELVRMAEEGMKYLQEVYNPILEKNGEPPLNIRFAEANFWKKSIMIAAPGHYRNARVLRQPIGGRIHLGHSSIGTPSNEEAQYRGWRVGTEISAALSRSSNLRRAR